MPSLPPNATIGIVGGGQLGRMSAMAAAQLGYRCHILSPEPDSPAAQVSAACTLADYEDRDALRRFAAAVDAITFEFENVSAEGLDLLASICPVRPSPAVLRISPRPQVLVLTACDEKEEHVRAFKLGAAGFNACGRGAAAHTDCVFGVIKRCEGAGLRERRGLPCTLDRWHDVAKRMLGQGFSIGDFCPCDKIRW